MTNSFALRDFLARKMKKLLRPYVEWILRRLPVSRLVFVERDAFAARLRALESAASVVGDTNQRLSAATQVATIDPHEIENLIPAIRPEDERTLMTTLCRDADVLPRVATAGAVVQEEDGTVVQIMHNGIKVLAGGYYGAWMQDLIARCKGVHEPQEEVVFAEIMKHVAAHATMIELGGFWSYYSIWFLSVCRGGRAIIVEPDPAHIDVGKSNAQLNACEPEFVQACVGRCSAPPSLVSTEESGEIVVRHVSVPDLVVSHGIDHLEVLHCDAQGIELDVLESCRDLMAEGRLGWIVLSTHSHHISHDPLTHQRCLALLVRAGASILTEHDVHESFSGDGLIVAKFGPVPKNWKSPRLSYNRYSRSLFRNPLYDLAAAKQEAKRLSTRLLFDCASLTSSGGLLTITADCSLGRIGDTLAVPFDQVMYPAIVADSGWAKETINFVMERVNPSHRYVVLDIGANVGLFTRQIALRLPNSTRFVCVEPELGNFRALQYNLEHLLGERVSLWNVALSDADNDARFFRDSENIGNYSLNADAMRGRPFDAITVRCTAADRWMHDQLQLTNLERLIWKSDTQGHDELIISRTPMEVWDRVDVAVVELWRIKKPCYDQNAFCQRLDAFPNKSIGIGNSSTTIEILQYLQADDWRHDDLYLWR